MPKCLGFDSVFARRSQKPTDQTVMFPNFGFNTIRVPSQAEEPILLVGRSNLSL